jgi:hypothetical protein
MRRIIIAIAALTTLLPISAMAHGPSPQKAIKEVIIKAEPAKLWGLVKDFGGIGKWHPLVASVKLEDRKDMESDQTLVHRIVSFKDGGSMIEKLREVNDAEMKIDYKMVETSLAVSNYRAVMQVKAGPGAGESTLTWTARFYNKANSMEAKPGEDNPAANAAINALYDAGVTGIKNAVEGK